MNYKYKSTKLFLQIIISSSSCLCVSLTPVVGGLGNSFGILEGVGDGGGDDGGEALGPVVCERGSRPERVYSFLVKCREIGVGGLR